LTVCPERATLKWQRGAGHLAGTFAYGGYARAARNLHALRPGFMLSRGRPGGISVTLPISVTL